MWNGTMFVDLDWPLNASSLLSASAELVVVLEAPRDQDPGLEDYINEYYIEKMHTVYLHLYKPML